MTRAKLNTHYGFTLIEMAVAMFVLALLLGSILVPLSTSIEQKQISDTEAALEDIKDALLGYALANGYIPCPDTNNDGAEDVAGTGLCSTIAGTISTGNLPWSTLGLGSYDVWGNRYRYVVAEVYARRSPATPFSLTTTTTNVRVCATASCATILTSNAAVAIVSMGKNGYGATNSISGSVNPAPTSTDELENLDTDRDLVSRTWSAVGSSAGEFDDIVTSISRFVLFNRMVMGQKLP